jgi:hypothetical protein
VPNTQRYVVELTGTEPTTFFCGTKMEVVRFVADFLENENSTSTTITKRCVLGASFAFVVTQVCATGWPLSGLKPQHNI